jgi:hypothetical protein
MRAMSSLPALLGLLLAALAVPSAAQTGLQIQSTSGELAIASSAAVEPFDTEAAAIIQYDDGEADSNLGGGPAVRTFELAMRFDSIGGTDVTLGGVDVCLQQVGSDPKIRYEVVVWAADGAGSTPGTELAHYAAVAEGVTSTPSFHSTSFNYPLTTSTVYIGVRYAPAADPDFRFCIDNDGATVHPGYYRFEEASAWTGIPTIIPAYNALMFRAYIYTPGVFLESLLVPSYRVDTLNPSGTTTLYAVRNLTDSAVTAHLEYFDVSGTSQRADSITLDPNDTQTVNVRDVAGLAADLDGYARGYVEISTAGDPHQTPVLGGDFFQVDVADNFATGDKLVRSSTDLCTESSIRFLAFPSAGSGTRLAVWLVNPRGAGLGDPASFTVQAFDENGTPQGSSFSIHTADKTLELEAADFAGALAFGFLRFDFSASNGGVVYSEAQAEGRYSIGMTNQCYEAP